MPSLRPRKRASPKPSHPASGFSLIELIVVIIIVGILAALALPRFISMGRDARVAAVNSMGAALWAAALQVHSACALSPSCNVNTLYQTTTLGGRPAQLAYGWPDAGDNLGAGQIDSWVTNTGFTVTLLSTINTFFQLDSANAPLGTCGVNYVQAGWPSASVLLPTVQIHTESC